MTRPLQFNLPQRLAPVAMFLLLLAPLHGQTLTAHPPTGAARAVWADGSTLTTGGDAPGGPLATTEIIDAKGRRAAAAPMLFPRSGHISIVLASGEVLVAGGTTRGGVVTSSAELYDPATNQWTLLPGLQSDRTGAAAALLADGSVLVAGGDNGRLTLRTMERFHPATQRFEAVSAVLSTPRSRHAAVPLQDGTLLFAGGFDGERTLDTLELFDPRTGTSAPAGRMATPRQDFIAALMNDGRVLLAGGSDGRRLQAGHEFWNGPEPAGAPPAAAPAALMAITPMAIPMAILPAATTTTTAVSSSLNPSIAGTSVQFTAVITPSTATGTVQFLRDGITLGSPVTVSGGTAVSTGISSLTVGTHTIKANFTGTGGYANSTGSLSQRVYLTSATSLASSANPVARNTSLRLTATVSPSTASGTVTFYDLNQGAPLGRATLSSGSASLVWPAALPGLRSLVAVYSGDGSYAASGSSTLLQAVKPSPGAAFTAPVAIQAFGQSLRPAAAADFNGDGKLDLVAADDTAATVWMLLGDGAGGFAAPAAFAAPFPVSSIAVGDFNRDGKLDVIALGRTVDSVATWLGDGAGGLGSAASVALPAGRSPVQVAVGDFNMDGRLDALVLATTSNTSYFSTLPGDGRGGFGSPLETVIGIVSAGSLAVGDFTLDGKLDVATVNLDPSLGGLSHILQGDGAGFFATNAGFGLEEPPIQGSLAVGFFSGDGLLDVAHLSTTEYACDRFGNGSTGYLSSGSCTALPSGSAAVSLAAGDFNGDGLSDVVTANSGTNTLSTLLAGSGGTLGAPTSYSLPSGYLPRTVVVGDFDGDGMLDLAVVNANTVSLLRGIPPVTTLSVTSSVPGSTYGSPVTLTAAVTPAIAAGTVQFKVDGNNLGSAVTVSGGTAVLTSSTIAAGTHTITAQFTGSGAWLASSATLAGGLTVNPAATTTALKSSANPAPAGASVTFTATVTAATGATPTGTVTFLDGAATVGTGTLSKGKASFTTAALTAGSHTITAVYGGSGNFIGSTSTALTEYVQVPTATTVVSSVNPSPFFLPVTFTATVQSPTGVPGGNVQFFDGATLLGTVPLSQGKAKLTTSTLSSGSHTIKATYKGNNTYATSTATLTQNVL